MQVLVVLCVFYPKWQIKLTDIDKFDFLVLFKKFERQWDILKFVREKRRLLVVATDFLAREYLLIQFMVHKLVHKSGRTGPYLHQMNQFHAIAQVGMHIIDPLSNAFEMLVHPSCECVLLNTLPGGVLVWKLINCDWFLINKS